MKVVLTRRTVGGSECFCCCWFLNCFDGSGEILIIFQSDIFGGIGVIFCVCGSCGMGFSEFPLWWTGPGLDFGGILTVILVKF